MMLSLFTLMIASVSAWLSYKTTEDVVKASMGFLAILFSVLTLLFAPWMLKLSLVIIPLTIVNKISSWSIENF